MSLHVEQYYKNENNNCEYGIKLTRSNEWSENTHVRAGGRIIVRGNYETESVAGLQITCYSLHFLG